MHHRLNSKDKSLKLFEENTGKCQWPQFLQEFLHIAQKSLTITEIINRFIKLKIFAKHVFDNRFISRTYKEL